ncbi:hypothetical protein BH20GEM3_BH20GEM3_04070 [soil metagenome]
MNDRSMDDSSTGGLGGTGGTGGAGFGGGSTGGAGGYGGTGSTGGSGAGSANTPDFGSDLDSFGAGTGGSSGSLGGSGLGDSASGFGTGSTCGSTGGVNDALGRAADTLEGAARRLDEFADQQGTTGAGGVKARAGAMASSVADTIESTAQYLRDSDVSNLQGNLERQVRENPLQTLLIGVAAGWVLGKILK